MIGKDWSTDKRIVIRLLLQIASAAPTSLIARQFQERPNLQVAIILVTNMLAIVTIYWLIPSNRQNQH